MGFKFFENNIPNEPDHITEEGFNDLVNHQLTLNTQNTLSIDNRSAVFLHLSRNRDNINELEWNHILQKQRKSLIENLWRQGYITHTIISQHENGLTLRTEINF